MAFHRGTGRHAMLYNRNSSVQRDVDFMAVAVVGRFSTGHRKCGS